MGAHSINKNWLTLEIVDTIVSKNLKIELSKEATDLVLKCRAYLDEKLGRHEEPIYGINTGFGSLCNTQISNEDLGKLQRNLVMSHACGMGEEDPHDIVRLMIMHKNQRLSYGHSGVQLKTIQRLIDFYNNDVFPVVYQQGSLGASGDLA
ncbi:MAG: aromatic amino acid lyase, partial [Flavobacteriales bacterium]|nr:aromatic amino acid lyase [Flavobacteriales bacterium]